MMGKSSNRGTYSLQGAPGPKPAATGLEQTSGHLSADIYRPTITAIIATYNYGRFLGAAIESVLGQTRLPDEIVVVDDGSTDDTAEIAALYRDKGVRYIRKENGGVSSARNVGIRETTGDFIAFLDSDDRWLPDKIERQARHLRSHPEVGLVTGGEWETDEAGSKVWRMERKPVASAEFYPRILVENSIGSPSLVMLRRECLDRVGLFDENVGLAQDWDLWIRLAKHANVAVLDMPLILYRRHGASMSSGPVWKRYKSNRTFQQKHIRPIRPARLRLRLLTAAQSMNLFYVAAYLSDTGTKRGTAAILALLSTLLDPSYHAKLKFGLLIRTVLGKNALLWRHRYKIKLK